MRTLRPGGPPACGKTAGRLARRLATALLPLLAPGLATAQSQVQTTLIGWEVGIGHESISAPLVRLDDRAPLVRVDGLTRLSGTHGRAVLSGLHEWRQGHTSLALSARAELRRAPAAPDLDLGMASVDAMLRHTVVGLTVGAGPIVQHVRVAGSRFREALGLQADAVWSRGADGHLALFAAAVVQRHGEAFRDLDGRAASLSLQRHAAQPGGGWSALDLELGRGREINGRGHPDQASRGALARVSLDRPVGRAELSLGVVLQQARFDAALIDGLPARRDRFRAVEAGLGWPLADGHSLRLELQLGGNAANLPLFDSRMRQLALNWVHQP